MYFYLVTIEGRDIHIQDSDNVYPGTDITGFFASRRVSAGTESEAFEKCKHKVLKEWDERGFQQENSKGTPPINLHKIEKISIFSLINSSFSTKGFTFY